jgi:DNA replication protein DnaC
MSHYRRIPAQPPMKFLAAKLAPSQRAVHSPSSYLFGFAAMLTLSAGAALFTLRAQAQTAAAPPAAAASRTQAEASATPAAKYSAKDLERAFNFMDANKDGKISREEAASFPNVAKYFDEADTDKDQMLSPEEFENAMNRSKAKAP